MTATLSRQQRRQMQRYTAEADRAVEGDRRFFARHTDRTYRVRLLSHAERAQMEAFAPDAFARQAAGWAAFVALKQIVPGTRMRVTVFGPIESIGEELTDVEARGVFEGYADRHSAVRDRETEIRAVLAQFGGAAGGGQ